MLIVEDGTGKVDAQAYIDASYLDGYAALRGEDLTAYSEAQKEAAIYVSVNDFIDVFHTFNGTKLNADQGLSLPTDKVVLTDVATHRDIQEANANAAILQLKSSLFVDTTAADTNGSIKSASSKVDVIEESTEYFEGTERTVKYNTPIVDRLLRPYIGGGGIQLKTT
ncbi:head completion adaptor [Vibrio phage 137E35-1]|nr:head completion adaptor [Vibrio phage 137E35-1]CAH9015504.1 head completion adaptor [Vibrio phage 230E39-1]